MFLALDRLSFFALYRLEAECLAKISARISLTEKNSAVIDEGQNDQS
jgi:hypothetical protein